MGEYISNYDKFPVIRPRLHSHQCWQGWGDTCNIIQRHIAALGPGKKIIALECYTGLHDETIIHEIKSRLGGQFFFTRDYMLEEKQIKQLVQPDTTDDAVFGYMTRLVLPDFFDKEKKASFGEKIKAAGHPVFIYGPGATILCGQPDLMIYFDMPRWEGQLRFRRNEVGNLGLDNRNAKASLQYKQAFYVDWRVCDKHKRSTMRSWDLAVDTTDTGNPKITTGAALRSAYEESVTQPFRLVPFFDPGPWGGQWMKKICDLDRNEKNYAWCFDCVPEENSLLIQFEEAVFETPAVNLVFFQSKQLLGEVVQARFGDEFPIRFDFLDTIEGGNLSLQVHPTNQYIREHFGMPYTQDESYYILDAEPDAFVYLGLKENIAADQMISELKDADAGNSQFNADKFVGRFPVKKHDHVLIPAGTIHCSGRNSMVLEISATPYLFTFKLWDWGRLGLDGKPRPINIERGRKVIDWSRTTPVVKKELINQFEPLASGDGWSEERTGLHRTEFIETRRHWFTGMVTHHTNGTVNVLNLVQGKEAVVESPSGAFDPFVVHYAETFIIPATVNEYTIRPFGTGVNEQCATVKAYVRS